MARGRASAGHRRAAAPCYRSWWKRGSRPARFSREHRVTHSDIALDPEGYCQANNHPRWNQSVYFNFYDPASRRSEEHTSELQSLMRISYAVFCLKKKQHVYLSHTHHNLSKKHTTLTQHH